MPLENIIVINSIIWSRNTLNRKLCMVIWHNFISNLPFNFLGDLVALHDMHKNSSPLACSTVIVFLYIINDIKKCDGSFVLESR